MYFSEQAIYEGIKNDQKGLNPYCIGCTSLSEIKKELRQMLKKS